MVSIVLLRIKKHLIILFIMSTVISTDSAASEKISAASQQLTDKCDSWRDYLIAKMPYLGHRNWLVITDMAYPLQSGNGITTIYADEPYAQVLSKVKAVVDAAPHVFAHVYRDKELQFIPDSDVPGIEALRQDMDSICGKEAVSLPHIDLIKKLDEAGRLYNVLIIKTPLTMPYTTTFFEFDCQYWDAERQAKLDKNMLGK